VSELAVVVGASGALGGAIAERLRAEGLAVVGVARGGGGPDRGTGGGAAGSGPSGSGPHGGAGGGPSGGPSGHTGGGAGGGLKWCSADIGSDDAVAAIAAAVGDRPVRMVVQAAGLPAAGPLATIEPDALGRAVALKCGGLLRLVRAVDTHLQPGARIVALGGHYGIEPAPYACAAGVTNAALANLVRQLATAYGLRGVTAHLVAPGPADTPRLRALSRQAAESRGVPVEAVLAERAAESPLGRLVTPAEVAWAVATLLAPEAAALDGSALALDVGARRGIF
jgi:NAD(P)-dependent dehydrogenase (short-subunit alcohol dehydrogenase family)